MSASMQTDLPSNPEGRSAVPMLTVAYLELSLFSAILQNGYLMIPSVL